jgi:hypothetical protein
MGAAGAADAASEGFVLEFQVAGGAWQRESLSSCYGVRFAGSERIPLRPTGKAVPAHAGLRVPLLQAQAGTMPRLPGAG